MHTIGSQTVFTGKVFNVRRDIVEENGRRRTIDLVEHALSYAIIARPKPDELLLVSQYRHAAGQVLLEIPAGMANPGESPREGALRELREETGYSAGRITEIFTLYPTPGFCDERLAFFLVDDLRGGATEFDDDEQIETRSVGIREALALLERGQIIDGKTALALLWLDRMVRQ